MKYLILIPLLMLLTSCGAIKDNCHLGAQTCRTLFGTSDFETDSNIEQLEARVKANEKDIKSLQLLLNSLFDSVFNIEANLVQNENLINLFQYQIDTLFVNQNTTDSLLISLQNSITNLNIQTNNQLDLINNQQTQINNTITNMAVLQGYNNIVSIKDPCGDKSNVYDEVFLVLSSGEMLASFSDNANGKNTRFSVLTVGTFVTTDNSDCNFTVIADPQPDKPNQVQITNEHY